MKIYFLPLFCFSLSSTIIYSQCSNTCGSNLLLNSSFETPTSSCGTSDIQLYNSQTPVSDWFGTDDYPGAGSSPDYFSLCAGTTNSANQFCITGNARVGVYTKTNFNLGREYVQSQLINPLIAGKTYCFSIVVKSKVGSAGNILSSCDGIGAWIHNQGLINIQTMNGGNQYLGAGSTINASPQVENPSGNLIGETCVTVTGTFCAQGSENWIVIGNFRDDVSTSIVGSSSFNYMYIDDVSLFEICSPTLDILVDNSDLNCGESANLTVNSTFPIGATYTWISPNGNTLNGINSQNVSPIDTTIYTLVATINGTCGLISDTASVTVNVGSCGINAVVNDSVICQGSCFNLQAYNTNGGQAPYTFEWKDENNNVIGNSSDPIQVCPIVSSTYFLQITDQNDDIFLDSSFIEVLNYPSITAGLDLEICQGNAITLSGMSDGTVEQWQTLGFGNLFQVSPLQSTDYIFESANGGCKSYDTVSVIVNSLPNLTLSATNISCFGLNNGSASVNANGNLPLSYLWSTNETTTAVQNLPTGFIVVTVTDGNNCQTRDSVFISEPTAITYQLIGDTILCQGELLSLNANPSGGVNPLTVTWDGIITANSYSFMPNSSTTVNVTIRDNNNCIKTDEISIIVNPRPIAIFDTTIQICQNQNVAFNNNSIGATSWNWYLNSALVSTQLNPVLGSFNNGCNEISLVVTNQFGCSDSLSNTCAIQVFSNPNSLIYTFDTEFIIGDPDIELFNNSIDSSFNCSWYVNNTLLSNECLSSILYNFNEIGNYLFDLIISNELGCSDTSSVIITVKEGLIYYVPNTFTPDGNEFNNTFRPIFTSGFQTDSYHLQIFNRWGELLFESYNSELGWDGSYNNKISKTDIYTWKIYFTDSVKNQIHQKVGHVNLIK